MGAGIHEDLLSARREYENPYMAMFQVYPRGWAISVRGSSVAAVVGEVAEKLSGEDPWHRDKMYITRDEAREFARAVRRVTTVGSHSPAGTNLLVKGPCS